MLKPIENLAKFGITLLVLSISGYIGWLVSWELNLSFGKTALVVLGAAVFVSAIILWIIKKFKEFIEDFLQVYLSVGQPKKKMRNNYPPSIQTGDPSQDSNQNEPYTYTVTMR